MNTLQDMIDDVNNEHTVYRPPVFLEMKLLHGEKLNADVYRSSLGLGFTFREDRQEVIKSSGHDSWVHPVFRRCDMYAVFTFDSEQDAMIFKLSMPDFEGGIVKAPKDHPLLS